MVKRKNSDAQSHGRGQGGEAEGSDFLVKLGQEGKKDQGICLRAIPLRA